MTLDQKEALYQWMVDVMHVLRQHVGQTPAIKDAEKTMELFRQTSEIQLQCPNNDED